MALPGYIDIHTHTRENSSDVLSVLNLFPDQQALFHEKDFFSVGLHPWDVAEGDVNSGIRIVNELAGKRNMLALGEIGLDKYKPEFELQKDVFIRQIEIARSFKKPITAFKTSSKFMF